MGYHMKTLHALNPRLTSSTHWSSNVIQEGFSSPLKLLGFADSQKSGAFMFLIVLIGLRDHLPFIAVRQIRSALESTEP